MSDTNKIPQDLLCEQLTAATGGAVCFAFQSFWSIDDEQGNEIPGTKGHAFYACTQIGDELLEDWFCDLNGQILEQAIERFEQKAGVLADIVNGLHAMQVKQPAEVVAAD